MSPDPPVIKGEDKPAPMVETKVPPAVVDPPADPSVSPEIPLPSETDPAPDARKKKKRPAPDETPPAFSEEPMPVDPPARPRPERLPLPKPEEAAAAAAEVKSVFKAEFVAARQPAEKRKLAERLIEQAKESEGPTSAYALLDEAAKLSVANTDYETAATAIDALQERFDVNAIDLKFAALQDVGKLAKLPEHFRAVADAASLLTDEALRAQRHDAALQINTYQLSAARKSKDAELVRSAAARTREIELLKRLFANLQTARATLEQNPDDAEANLLVGKHLCLADGDWEAGLKLLAKGSDLPLRNLAERDLAGPESWEKRLQLGDDWWDYGLKSKDLQIRAMHWYEQAQPQLTGLAKTKVEKRIEDLTVNNPSISSASDGQRLAALLSEALVVVTFDDATLQPRGRGWRNFARSDEQANRRGNPESVTGVAGEAVRIDPQKGSVRIETDLAGGASPRTLAAWFKFDHADPAVYMSYGSMKKSDTSAGFGFAVRSNNFCLELNQPLLDSKMPVDQKWHFHCALYDGKQASYIIDNRLVARQPVVLNTVKSAGIVISQNCYLDEFVYFNRALTEREILRIYQQGRARRPLREVK
jgi:hypothetical protein